MQNKKCCTCKSMLPRAYFYPICRGGERLQASCKKCKKIREQAFRKTNPEWFQNFELKRRRGISLEQYNAMLAKQYSKCAICETHAGICGRLHVDHSHTTGRIRGLLCNNCNRSIGLLKDSIGVLKKAVDYLEIASETKQ
jgi:hypothetical protein